jgi:hypothetical protein
MPKGSRPFGIAPPGERLLALTPLYYGRGRRPPPAVAALSQSAFLGLLGWNSYGTEGTQPVANVRHAERRKMA